MIVVISGDIKNGKSLLLSMMLYNDWLRGQKIVSNHWLGFPHTQIDTVNIREGVELSNVTLGLDELQKFLDCRDSSDKWVKSFSKWLTDIGKNKNRLYCSSHTFKRLDKRVREHTNLRFIIEKIVQFYDFSDFKYKVINMYNKRSVKFLLPYFVAQPYFDYYKSEKLLLSSQVSPTILTSTEGARG